jgi:hypothetical protein
VRETSTCGSLLLLPRIRGRVEPWNRGYGYHVPSEIINLGEPIKREATSIRYLGRLHSCRPPSPQDSAIGKPGWGERRTNGPWIRDLVAAFR